LRKRVARGNRRHSIVYRAGHTKPICKQASRRCKSREREKGTNKPLHKGRDHNSRRRLLLSNGVGVQDNFGSGKRVAPLPKNKEDADGRYQKAGGWEERRNKSGGNVSAVEGREERHISQSALFQYQNQTTVPKRTGLAKERRRTPEGGGRAPLRIT